MSDTANTPNGAQANGGAPASATPAKAPSVNILAQYIKDLSFESPKAPAALRTQTKSPAINIGVNVAANPVAGTENEYDVKLTLNARAGEGDDTLFHAELVYGGVFRLTNLSKEHVLPVLFIECPRLLFPFARQIIADVSRNGGFPPLMIDPIDFTALFQQRLAEERAKAQVQPSANA
ncbi:protein-export chaperone SecB [Aureimonas mangrovi]|uniref:protein-export chaperone SecB n=1 Tax=Aureimonas mangrovi TaxID=2758041 RepID=UPI00163DCB74|nr:protein-export chaperone SecB [Aureimonas mangrovi]